MHYNDFKISYNNFFYLLQFIVYSPVQKRATITSVLHAFLFLFSLKEVTRMEKTVALATPPKFVKYDIVQNLS